ncbi:MAG: flagellar filament capping protein FliD [Schwartzia sp. (in: firmicutes)]
MGVNGIYGLSGSGLDIESLVKVGMLGKQKQYDKLQKREIKAEMEKEIFADIYKDLFSFKYTTLSDYKLQSNMSAMKAASSADSFVTAKANGAAVPMPHTVKVNRLSSNAHLLTKDKIQRDGIAPNSIQLRDNVFKSLTKNADGTYTYEDSQGTHTVAGDAKAITFSINGTKNPTAEEKAKTTISYTFEDLANGKTYNDLAADITAKGTGVTASYDATTDSFSLYNKTSGKEAGITLSMAAEADGGKYAAQLFNNLNLEQSKEGALHALPLAAGETKPFKAGGSNGCMGDDGSATIDGKTYEGIKNNSLNVGGVSYNFLQKHEGNAKATITVSQDTDKIIENVKKFVEDYNKILDDLSTKYNTSSWNYNTSSDYEPLTEKEKSGMTQTQIDEWNKKVKSGLLYHNKIVGKMLTAMREAISTPVQSVAGQYNSAASIGITSSDNKGHLKLDEDKLKKALAAEPDCVHQIFANDQDNYYDTPQDKKHDYIRSDDYKNRGIVNRLYYNAIDDGLKDVKEYAGISSDSKDETILGKKITRFKNEMTTFKGKMDTYQTKLFKRYDAMEALIGRLNSVYNAIFGGAK